MQDLTGKFPQALVPSAMSAGGEVHDTSLALTAPGSQPVSGPLPSQLGPETLPMPDYAGEKKILGGSPFRQGEEAVPFSTVTNEPGEGPWSRKRPTSPKWDQTP